MSFPLVKTKNSSKVIGQVPLKSNEILIFNDCCKSWTFCMHCGASLPSCACFIRNQIKTGWLVMDINPISSMKISLAASTGFLESWNVVQWIRMRSAESEHTPLHSWSCRLKQRNHRQMSACQFHQQLYTSWFVTWTAHCLTDAVMWYALGYVMFLFSAGLAYIQQTDLFFFS